MTNELKLTKELLEKYFGKDESWGETCDCKECTIRNQILKNQENAEKYKILKEILGEENE
ncbi:MAG: hypothetical protein ACE5H1_06830 [Thermodesulfobacteriota bacterium]